MARATGRGTGAAGQGGAREGAARLVPVLTVFLCALAAFGSAQSGVYPRLNSVRYDQAREQVTASFGYTSINSQPVAVNIGAGNFFSPPPSYRDQPTVFQPGSHDNVFETTFRLQDEEQTTWTLLGTRVSASLNSPRLELDVSSSFTYQGRLKSAAGGDEITSCDLLFTLWSAATGGSQLGTTVTRTGVSVTGGLFSTELNFGHQPYNAGGRWIEVSVRTPSGGTGPYTLLSPRQHMTPAPMAAAVRGLSIADNGTITVAHEGSQGRGVTITLDGRVGLNQPNPGHPLVVGSSASDGNGAYLSPGGVWTNGSDQNSKTAFQTVNVRDILERVAALPLTSWRYKGEPEETRHLGPMAQQFKAAFGLGTVGDDKHIGTVDADGVALAAIQALKQDADAASRRIDQVEEENRTLKEDNRVLKVRFREMEERNAALEKRLQVLERRLAE